MNIYYIEQFKLMHFITFDHSIFNKHHMCQKTFLFEFIINFINKFIYEISKKRKFLYTI